MLNITVVSGRVDALKQALEGPLASRLPTDTELHFFNDPDIVDGPALGAEIALGAPDVLAPLLKKMPNLRWVQSTWAGITPFLQAPRRDYLLTGVKGIFGSSMSEYALGWVLALERSVLKHASSRQWDPRPDRGLSSLTVGVAGVGSIGSVVAQSFAPFAAEVRGLNSDGSLVSGCTRCFSIADRAAFARGLDVLVMLLPDTPATDRVVDARLLSQLTPGAIVINAGRANALDVTAATAALAEGQISALVLDVLETEPLPEGDPLWTLPGVYITSHTAAPTDMERIVGVFLDNLDCYRAGRPLAGAIDFQRGY